MILGCNSICPPAVVVWAKRELVYTAGSTRADAQIHPFIASSFHQTSLALLSHSMPLTASFNRPPLALLYHIIITPLPSIHPGKGYSNLHYTSCLLTTCSCAVLGYPQSHLIHLLLNTYKSTKFHFLKRCFINFDVVS